MGEARQAGAELIEQAIDWLVSLDCGTADEAAFNAWRDADPRHAAAFAQVAAAWRRTTDSRMPMLLKALAVAEAAPEPPSAEPDEAAEPGWTRRAVAGGFVLAALAAGGVFMAWPGRASAETAIGERRMVRLPDGSHAMLNTDTRLSWRFDGDRRVWLERGEAALIVASAATPLALSSDAIDAELGKGRFAIRKEEQGGQLLVLAGRAEASYRGAPSRTIGAGSRLAVRDGRGAITALSPDEVVAATAWEQGKILFNGMPLDRAVAEFNRYLAVPLVLGDADLASVRLGGEFEVADPDGFLMALKDGFAIDHRAEAGRILLFRAG